MPKNKKTHCVSQLTYYLQFAIITCDAANCHIAICFVRQAVLAFTCANQMRCHQNCGESECREREKKSFFSLKICLLLCNVKWLVISYETRSVQKSNTDLVLMMCVCVVVYWTCVRWTFCNKSSGTIDQRMYTTKRNKSRRTQKIALKHKNKREIIEYRTQKL